MPSCIFAACSSLTYNAREIKMLLKTDGNVTNQHTVEWIVIDPASFTGKSIHCNNDVHPNTSVLSCRLYYVGAPQTGVCERHVE